MTTSKIDNVEIRQLTEDILLVHQKKPPFYFSCSDGIIILPKKNRNDSSIVLDLNIEPHLIDKLNNIYGPFTNYINSHGHMDHIAHVHKWESIGAKIHAPFPEHVNLLDLRKFYKLFGFFEEINFSVINKFAKKNGYKECQDVIPFKPGYTFKFENLIIETIPLLGHSKAHVGFLIPEERLFHISCLGFDKVSPDKDGFGPWYGFKECSIEQYLIDITQAELIFLERANFLTSSHSYIVKSPDKAPFIYMREKIAKNQNLVDNAIKSHNLTNKSMDTINYLLNLDIFFPKRKMEGYLLEIYNFWESGIIRKHIERSEYLN
ncbi:MAG: MBL fold metallo-hydrolase [Candidatus Lokiarchaeota archaeon]|nr:MBL fold metallo-hydrolase [Candidatus Lokiarchaeota archaeon]